MDPTARPETVAPPAGPPAALRARPRAAARRLAGWAVLAQFVLIALGDNQWVTERAAGYVGGGGLDSGFARQFVLSTQVFSWRFTPAAGEGATAFVASFVQIGGLLVVTALLVALLVHGGRFARTAIATLVIVVFASQVAAVAFVAVLGSGSGFPGGRLTAAFFVAPNGYRFMGGLILGVLVGVVVGLVARGLGAAGWSSDPFFPPGTLQRIYEANRADPPVEPPYPAPGAPAPGTPVQPIDLTEPEPGRHARDLPDWTGG